MLMCLSNLTLNCFTTLRITNLIFRASDFNMKFIRKNSKKYLIQVPDTKQSTSYQRILWATCIAFIIFFCFGIGLVIYYHGLQSSITDAETNSSSTTSSSKIPDCNLKERKYVRKPAENDWHYVTISKMSNGNCLS